MDLFTDHMEYQKTDYLDKSRNKEKSNNKMKAILKRIFNKSQDQREAMHSSFAKRYKKLKAKKVEEFY